MRHFGKNGKNGIESSGAAENSIEPRVSTIRHDMTTGLKVHYSRSNWVTIN